MIRGSVTKNRLSKILAAAGIASRRASEELIFKGKVKVNGEVVCTPQTMVDPQQDDIIVNGKLLPKTEDKVYYLLNKPKGYICSSQKKSSTPIIYELFQEEGHRLFSVGRLDKDTEGLLLITNDGHFANRVIHPSATIQKEYLVKVDQEITEDHLIAISNGTLVEGTFVKPKSVKKVRKGTLKIVIMEGKKREVRSLLEGASLKVKSLTRIRLGGLILGALPAGSWRPLTEREKKLIFE